MVLTVRMFKSSDTFDVSSKYAVIRNNVNQTERELLYWVKYVILYISPSLLKIDTCGRKSVSPRA